MSFRHRSTLYPCRAAESTCDQADDLATSQRRPPAHPQLPLAPSQAHLAPPFGRPPLECRTTGRAARSTTMDQPIGRPLAPLQPLHDPAQLLHLFEGQFATRPSSAFAGVVRGAVQALRLSLIHSLFTLPPTTYHLPIGYLLRRHPLPARLLPALVLLVHQTPRFLPRSPTEPRR